MTDMTADRPGADVFPVGTARGGDMDNEDDIQRRDADSPPRRKFRDTLFVNMFGRNINAKEYFLSLYNAIHGTDFRIGEVEIKPVMLENVVYKGLENDVSMEINGAIVVLAEQQSTVNHNMPFRCLEYLVAHYNRFFERGDKYSTRRVTLPRPECYVFYNGDAPFPQEAEMRLSDAFRESGAVLPKSLQLDLTVKVYNINKSANHPILARCEPLLAYSNFTEYARMAKAGGKKNPVAYALRESRKGDVLAEYFDAISREEQSMIFGEWDEEEYRRVMKREAFEDGHDAGVAENARTNARNFLKEGDAPEKIARCCSLPLDVVLALKEELSGETAMQ